MCNPGDKYKNSRLFDPYRWSTATEVDAACDELRQLLGLNDRRYKPYVMMALLDLYCSWRSDPTQYVSFSRDKNRYGKYSRYASILVGHRGVVTITDRLRKEGFIDYGNAICYRNLVTGIPYAGYTTRMKATKKLIRLIVKHKVKLAMISRHPNEAVIKFRTEKDENDVARDIKDFQAPEDVKRSAKALIRYNDLLQKTYIDLDDDLLTDTDLKELKRYDKKLKRNVVEYSIDLSKKRVYRVFSNEDWKQGGRIYGAWWHGCPKELRKYILINGEPVIELDFSAIHILLLYAHLGDNFLDEGVDAYTIEGHDFRKAMKVVMMSAINAKSDEKADGDTRAIMATWDTLIKKLNKERKEYGINSHDSLYEMLEAIKERHQPIAEFLASGEGIKLQKEDSDIAIEIIKQHTKMNVPILSVHDSFIVPRYFEPFTRDIMNQAYGRLVAKYLGAGYASEIETINCITGEIFKEETDCNLNVQGLIKPAFKPEVLRDAYMRLDQRTDTQQLWRHRRWKNNKYQFDKVTKFLQQRGSSSGGNQVGSKE
ncbi:MAG: hypothetical protein J0665_18540 [Deltaproteobacteria bacterium]|nr:hypothetical protein [Deltaproteobacteria bacterium]